MRQFYFLPLPLLHFHHWHSTFLSRNQNSLSAFFVHPTEFAFTLLPHLAHRPSLLLIVFPFEPLTFTLVFFWLTFSSVLLNVPCHFKISLNSLCTMFQTLLRHMPETKSITKLARTRALYIHSSFVSCFQVLNVVTSSSTDNIKPMREFSKRASACGGPPCLLQLLFDLSCHRYLQEVVEHKLSLYHTTPQEKLHTVRLGCLAGQAQRTRSLAPLLPIHRHQSIQTSSNLMWRCSMLLKNKVIQI